MSDLKRIIEEIESLKHYYLKSKSLFPKLVPSQNGKRKTKTAPIYEFLGYDATIDFW